MAPLRDIPDASRARWVDTDALHLTLRFLGATAPERVTDLDPSLRRVAAEARAFEVRLERAGAFPSQGRPRVLWVGIDEGAVELASLAERVNAFLDQLGWPPEPRPFKPHLTVARTDAVPHRAGAALADALIGRADRWATTFRADRLTLYRSHLGRGPARYESLVEAPLGT